MAGPGAHGGEQPVRGLGLPVGIEAPALDLSIDPHTAGVLPAGAHRQERARWRLPSYEDYAKMKDELR